MRRLLHIAPVRPQISAEPPTTESGATPPTLLTDEQMKSYVQNGFIALPVSDLPDEWHNAFWQRCHDWLFRGEVEAHKMPDGGVSRPFVYPHIPELSAVTQSPTVRGALTSILGPGYAQHPHRTMHNYGKANGHEDQVGQDQTWHKGKPPTPPPREPLTVF